MKISKNGIDLITKFEGFKSRPYLCPSGIPTIGYGNTYYPDGMKVPAKEWSTEVFSVVKDWDEQLIREFEFYTTGTARWKILYTYI